MKRTKLLIALLLSMLLCMSACSTPAPAPEGPAADGVDPSAPLFAEAPGKFFYGVYLNRPGNGGDKITDYGVAFNNFADRDAYALYSDRGMTQVQEELAEADLAALVSANKAVAIKSNDGFHALPETLLSLEGKAFDSADKTKFYRVFVAYESNTGLALEQADGMIAPQDGPAALEKYSNNAVGAIVPAGGSTSMFTQSSGYSPDYIAALTQGAREMGVEKPRVAVIETTVGTEQEMYDDMFLPDEDWPSFSDAMAQQGMEPIYIPLGADNYEGIQNVKYFADLIRSCHVVFFTGGNQANYALALANMDGSPSLVAEAIIEVLQKGGTLGGSSAGAAAMSKMVLSHGANGSYEPLYWNSTETANIQKYYGDRITGLETVNDGNNLVYQSIGFVEPILGRDVMIDTHVDARGRVGRTIIALRDTNPTGMAIAVDETGVFRIDGATKIGTASGTSGTFIIDAANAVWNEAGEIGGFGVTGLKMHYLTMGDQYDFNTGKVIPAADKKAITPAGDPYTTTDLFGTDGLATALLNFAQCADTSMTTRVRNTPAQPYLMGNVYEFTFEKTADTQAAASGEKFPNPKYFGDYCQTTLSHLNVSVVNKPTDFDPNAGGDFAPQSATSESNGYAVGITFSGPLSVGYSGNNDYFLDCEVAENVPTDYVVVTDANGVEKAQDRTYTFRVDNENTLRIVLVDDVFFAEGDNILVKTTITSLYGSTAPAEVNFKLVGDQWIMEEGAAAAAFGSTGVTGEENGYAVNIAFNQPLSVGYSGNNNYFKDCEVAENVPTDYVVVTDANGVEKAQDRTYTFRLGDNDKSLRIVLVDDVYFAEGDTVKVLTTITSAKEETPEAEVVYTLTGGVWVDAEGNGPVAAEPEVPAGPFAAVSAAGEDNGYAVNVTFTAPLSVGYSGNNNYFLDCEQDANVPTNYVVVTDVNGAEKAQDRTYTFRLGDNDKALRIVLVDDVFFAEGDTVKILTTVTSATGETPASETAFTLKDGAWVSAESVQPFAAVSAAGEDNGYAVNITFTAPLSVGYSGNNNYFLDCEQDANVPTNYVVVTDANGAEKAQDRTYTFRLGDNDKALRIVLVDDVFFAEGDTVKILTTVTSATGETPASEVSFKLAGGVWSLAE